MSKLVIVDTIEATPGKRDQVASLLMAHRTRCPNDEPGTLQFDVLLPREDDARVIVLEVYQDDSAFEVHRSAPSIAQWRQDTAGMIVKLVATRCTPAE